MNIVIYGYYGKKNTGDELILQVMGNYINQLSQEFSINAYVLPALGAKHTYKPSINTLKVLSYSKSRLLSRLGFFQNAANTDLLILGGGGIIQDHENNKSGPIRSLLKRALIVRRTGGRVILFGIGVSPLKTTIGRLLTRALCRCSDLITVRDMESFQALADIGVGTSRIHVTGDLVPSWSPVTMLPDTRSKPEQSPIIVVSTLPYHLEKAEPTEKTELFRRELASALDLLLSVTKGQLRFLSFQGDPPNYDKAEAEAVMRYMQQRKNCRIIDYAENPEVIFQQIKMADLVIGMRLHSIVLACMAKRPFIAIAYHSKVTNFTKAVNKPHWTVTRDDVCNGFLEELVSTFVNHSMPEMQSNELAPLKKAAMLNFIILRNYLLQKKFKNKLQAKDTFNGLFSLH